MITILCIDKHSNYHKIEGLDLYSKERNAYNFTGSNPVICHAPCTQWSRLHKLARSNYEEKNLAIFCWQKVLQNGGIFEHPAGSHFFKYVNASRKNILSVNQSWFGFPARKITYLYFSQVKPLSFPITFNHPLKTIEGITSSMRSRMPLAFCTWLIECVNQWQV